MRTGGECDNTDKMKYYCTNCKNIINENEIEVWQEKTLNYGDDPRKCEHEYCPICHAEYTLEEMSSCELCGAEIVPHKTFCDECSEIIDGAWEVAVQTVKAKAKYKPYRDIENLILDWLEVEGIL